MAKLNVNLKCHDLYPGPGKVTCLTLIVLTLTLQDLAKLLEDQHGYIDLQNISDAKYYSMDQNPDEEEKL